MDLRLELGGRDPCRAAVATWSLHNRNLTTIYINHGHFDHFFRLAILMQRFPRVPGHCNFEVSGVDASGNISPNQSGNSATKFPLINDVL
jgi:hypothetical protein